jgi:hypothetical protein
MSRQTGATLFTVTSHLGADQSVEDRSEDLGLVSVHLVAHTDPAVHVYDSATARSLAAAFTQAAELLEAHEAKKAGDAR